MVTAILVGVAAAVLGFVAGLLVGRKNPALADQATRLSEKLK